MKLPRISQYLQLSLALTMLPVVGLTPSLATESPAKPQASESTTPKEPRQEAHADNGGIAVNASGNAKVEIHQTIQQRDPELARTVKRLQKLIEQHLHASGHDSTADRQRLEGEAAGGVDEVLRRAREPGAQPAALAAKRGLENGDTRDAEMLLLRSEENAASKQTQDRSRAAELARQQGALAMTRNTKAALAAYQRATEYEPDNADNWWSLGDLLLQSLKRADAIRAYQHMTDLAEERAQREPANLRWRTQLVTGYRKLVDGLLAQDDVPHAVEAASKGLALSERWVAEQPSSHDAQYQLILSLVQKGRVQLAATADSALKSPPAGASAHETMQAFANRIAQSATEAEALFRRALTLVDTQLDRDIENDYLWLQNANCHTGIARSLALQLRRGARGEFSRSIDSLMRLAQKNPDNAYYQRTLALGYSALGSFAAHKDHDAGTALSAYRSSLEILRTLNEQDPSNPQTQLDLVNLYEDVAWLAQPWVAVPSLFDLNYRDYMKPPLLPPTEAIAMLQDGQRILAGLEAEGLLSASEKALQQQIEFDLEDLHCQQKGFESGSHGQCFRPLPAHISNRPP